MKKFYLFLLGLCSLTSSALFAEGSEDEKSANSSAQEIEIDMQRVSEAFGHLIGNNLESLGFKFDIRHVLKGIEDSIAGKSSPMSETECVQAISVAQEASFQRQAEENLAKANTFMEQNAHEKEVVVLEKERLHYKVEKSGTGAEVQAHFNPVIKYTGHFIDGTVFGASRDEEMVSLDETISGFSRGIIGMKEGEKRTIFIHPELGYGTSGYLPPNSLLTFEIELVKANAGQDDQSSLTSNVRAAQPGEEEIALPNMKEMERVR